MAVVDASFLVAAWNEREPDHAEARRKLQANPASLRVNAGALGEASQVIRRTANAAGLDGNATARGFLDAFLAVPGVSIATSEAAAGWSRFVVDPSLSYVDAWLIEQGKVAGEEVWSFDKRVLAAMRKK